MGEESAEIKQKAAAATMKAVRFYEYGGPEVLNYEDVPRPVPEFGQALVRVKAASILGAGGSKGRKITHKTPLEAYGDGPS